MSWVLDIDLFLYINLSDRKDRDREMKEVLIEQLKIPKQKIHRINAIRKKPGFEGCTRSHILALEYAIEAKAKNVCIMEDDFMLTVSPAIFHKQVSTAWSFLKKFDILFLTMTPIVLEATKVKPLHRVKQALAMPAMIIHHSYYAKLKYIYELALKEKIPHDLVTQRYQKNDLWYGIYPAIARQRPGFSDIEGRNVDYKYLDVDGKMLQMIDMTQSPELLTSSTITSTSTTPKEIITNNLGQIDHSMKTMFGTLIKRS